MIHSVHSFENEGLPLMCCDEVLIRLRYIAVSPYGHSGPRFPNR